MPMCSIWVGVNVVEGRGIELKPRASPKSDDNFFGKALVLRAYFALDSFKLLL